MNIIWRSHPIINRIKPISGTLIMVNIMFKVTSRVFSFFLFFCEVATEGMEEKESEDGMENEGEDE